MRDRPDHADTNCRRRATRRLSEPSPGKTRFVEPHSIDRYDVDVRPGRIISLVRCAAALAISIVFSTVVCVVAPLSRATGARLFRSWCRTLLALFRVECEVEEAS